MPKHRELTVLEDIAHKHICKVLRKKRKEQKLTMKNLADMCGVSYQQIQKYESGINKISAAMIFSLAAALKAQPEDFFPEMVHADV